MKYTYEAFAASEEACQKVNRSYEATLSDDIRTKQKQALILMLAKLRVELTKSNPRNGVIKAEFHKDKDEDAFSLIKSLLGSNDFDGFAREYCIYMGDIHHDTNYSSYPNRYEVIWDYQTYYEHLKNIYPNNIPTDGGCQNNNHTMGEWVAANDEHKWTRRCSCCGYSEVTRTKPLELEVQELKESVKLLQKIIESK